ncbi:MULTISPECIES: cbb3-type cytochrome oxidase assembly protein CcoS [Gammaproteobacteria]|uniref:cbb3-type cytochrome oxidase assembly protein CcoS n=1 Tax=Gammaproteobacteria TaxID=1236 RepID=UPI000DD04554|nr:MULTISPECIES: cbb3-type cytochrome oxidase assembly protein CcoS [Gammaproteobacteria]RTE87245.1 cbb3-type cytochrome oxidase assembly protein CcoS [Aliidiomarina sp. B3213]TCZ92968.1 cbb3-type cytochrome oxidase assembly protein CcoS [Lysobacter sp. N42]
MEALHIMVPIAIILVVIAIIIFFWAIKNGQFDDLERQGMNLLLDDDKPKKDKKTKSPEQE